MKTNPENAGVMALPCPENVFVSGKRRITFITPRLLRCEWAEDGRFEDRRTIAVVNRNLGRVELTVEKQPGKYVISSGCVTVETADSDQKFSGSSLQVRFDGKVWNMDMPSDGNLKGSYRTLDCCEADEFIRYSPEGEIIEQHKIKLGDGFISRDGWSRIDDSNNAVIDLQNGRPWVAARPEGERQDFYLFFYGHDYRGALRDASGVFGRQPLIPRYALGYWYSRYWAYNDEELCRLSESFDRAGIPLDVLVIDMDWHLEGWTGYTWDKRYFPDPDGFLRELKRRGLKITLNLHPAEGVGKHEAQFEKMAAAMGLDPEKTDRVPFDICSMRYMDNYFKLLHHPEERRGVDFWWMDWQQGESTAIRGLDTLPWINRLHWEDMEKRDKRPLIFSRFAGPGSGRYAVGFSGDTYSTWKSLAYQPYFTAAAANVLYGYWSHDIGGHMPGKIAPELYLRWIQYGVFSPILRTHTTKNPEAERRFDAFPPFYRDLMIEAVNLRYELVPYIYSEMKKAADESLSLCRPLYYDFPEDENAYSRQMTYFFGNEMLAAPVTVPGDERASVSEFAVHLPEGEWFDIAHGRMVNGGRMLEGSYLFSEIPLFVRPGPVIPGQSPRLRLNEKSYSRLVMNIYPGEKGGYQMYEDDGISIDYLSGRYAVIDFRHERKNGFRQISVRRISGDFNGFAGRRKFEVRLHCVIPPQRVEVNGGNVPFCYRFSARKSMEYRYDGVNCTLIIKCGTIDLDAENDIRVYYGTEDEFTPASGLRGVFRRLQKAAELHNQMNGHIPDGVETRLGQELAHAAYRIARHPENFANEAELVKRRLADLPGEAEKQWRSVQNKEMREFHRRNTEAIDKLVKSALPLLEVK